MKSYSLFTCSVLLVGVICAVLAFPSPDSSASDDSISESKEELLLTFPEYSLIPPNLLEALFPDSSDSSDSSSSSDSSDSSSLSDSSISDSASDESGSEPPQGRTIFLLLRLLQLLAQTNSTLLG